MKIVIEFYRTPEGDDAHASSAGKPAEAAGLDQAIEIARRLSQTLNMPQRPDAISIRNGDGNKLYSSKFDPTSQPGIFDERPPA